jgi:transposase
MDINIIETKEYLADLLYGENDKRKRERLQFLYWQKSGLATTRSQLAALLCKSLPTITAWARRYQELGLHGFLGMDYKGGVHLRIIPLSVIEELDARLNTAEGFGSFAEIRAWLKDGHGVDVAYSTVHGLVKYGLNASPKVVRPFSEKQDPEAVEEFEKTLAEPLAEVAKPCLARYAAVRYWVQDESRFSLKTVLRRRITKSGVRPRVKTKSTRKGYSLYGAVEVRTGDHFFHEGARMNTEGFQEFIDRFSGKYPLDFHIMQVDNAKFHTTAKLALPDNVVLLYQPPYSPEENPIEQVWGWAKGRIAGEIFETVEHLKERVNEIIADAGNAVFKSIIHREFILNALQQAGI